MIQHIIYNYYQILYDVWIIMYSGLNCNNCKCTSCPKGGGIADGAKHRANSEPGGERPKRPKVLRGVPKSISLVSKWKCGRWSIFGVIFFILSSDIIIAQNDNYSIAESFFRQGAYSQAIVHLNRIDGIEAKGPLVYKRAVCNYYLGLFNKAATDFHQAEKIGYFDVNQYIYLSGIHRYRAEYDKAAELLKEYLRKQTKLDKDKRKEILKQIAQCGEAQFLHFVKSDGAVVQLGHDINSVYDEIGFVQSYSHNGVYYFSSNKPEIYNMDKQSALKDKIYRLDNNKSGIDRIGQLLLGGEDGERLIGITETAEHLIVYSKESNTNNHYLAYKNPLGKYQPKYFEGLNDYVKDSMCGIFFYNDSSVLFASKSLDGFGGYDLFATVFFEGKWLPPINLGPEVNSEYDELCPYYDFSEATLYFSSDRVQSFGGFDVFASKYFVESMDWIAPINMGQPLNSPDDELYFTLDNTGTNAYFSSNRKSSIGRYDIFRLTKSDTLTESFDYLYDFPFFEYPHSRGVRQDPHNTIIEDTVFSMPYTQEVLLPKSTPKNYGIVSLPVIHYHKSSELFSNNNIEKLRKVVDYLREYPSSKLEILSTCSEENILAYNLYYSIKRAEEVFHHFVSQGIPKQRIVAKGLGSIEHSNGKKEHRLYLRLLANDTVVEKSEYVEIDQVGKDFINKYSASCDKKLNYSVKLSSTKQMYRGINIEKHPNPEIEYNPYTGMYDYTIGRNENLSVSIKLLNQLLSEGYSGSKIVVSLNGFTILASQFHKYLSQFPELKEIQGKSFLR